MVAFCTGQPGQHPYAVREHDFYATAPIAVEKLVEADPEHLNSSLVKIWEPAAGNGGVARTSWPSCCPRLPPPFASDASRRPARLELDLLRLVSLAARPPRPAFPQPHLRTRKLNAHEHSNSCRSEKRSRQSSARRLRHRRQRRRQRHLGRGRGVEGGIMNAPSQWKSAGFPGIAPPIPNFCPAPRRPVARHQRRRRCRRKE